MPIADCRRAGLLAGRRQECNPPIQEASRPELTNGGVLTRPVHLCFFAGDAFFSPVHCASFHAEGTGFYARSGAALGQTTLGFKEATGIILAQTGTAGP